MSVTAPPPSAYGAWHRVLAVVIALVCILVAGVITQLGQAIDEDSRQVWADVGVDQPAAFTFGELSVTDVRVGGVLAVDDERTVSAGRYVVVDLRIDAVRERGRSLQVELDSGERTYLPLVEGTPSVAAGFTVVSSWVFELPTDAVGELTLRVRPTEIITNTPLELRHRTSISADRVAASAPVVVRVAPDEVVAR